MLRCAISVNYWNSLFLYKWGEKKYSCQCQVLIPRQSQSTTMTGPHPRQLTSISVHMFSRTHAELEEMFFMFRDVFQPGEIPWHEGSLIWPFSAPLLVHYQWFCFLMRLGGGLNFPSLDFRHLTPTCKEIELSVNLTVIGPFLSISSFLRSRQYVCFCRFFRVSVGIFGNNGNFSLFHTMQTAVIWSMTHPCNLKVLIFNPNIE